MTRTGSPVKGTCVALVALTLVTAPLMAREIRARDRTPDRDRARDPDPIQGLLLEAESGEPLAGARVSVGPLPPRGAAAAREDARAPEEPLARGVSDARGEFALGVRHREPLRVLVRAPGRLPLVRDLLPGSPSRRLAPVAVPAARPLRLRVVTPSGDAVPGADVTLRPAVDAPPWDRASARGWRPLPRHGTTGDDGSLTLAIADGERVWIETSAAGFLPDGPLPVPGAVTAAPRPGEVFSVTLKPAPPRQRRATAAPPREPRLEGRLAGPDGAPSSAFVWTDADPGAAVATDARGRFRLPVPADARWVVAAADGRLSRFGRTSALLSLEAPVTLRLEPAAELTGKVVDPAGRPIPWARIEADLDAPGPDRGPAGESSPDPALAPARTVPPRLIPERPAVTWAGADGRFRLGGLPVTERYTLQVECRGFDRRMVHATRGRGGELEIELVPDRLAFGEVLDADARPISGATVLLEPRGDPSGRRIRRTLTLADGGFEIADLGAGRWDLLVSHPEHATARVPGLVIPRPPGAVDLGTVVLGAEAVLAGLVTDPRGRPIEGAAVRLSGDGADGSGPPEEVPTDAAGGFVLRGLTPGTSVDLRVAHPDHVSARLDGVSLPAPEPLTIVLEDGFRLAGRVLDDDGDPVARARVRLDAPAGRGPSPEGSSGSDGRFAIEGIPAGTYGAVARATGYRDSERVEVEIDRDAPPVELVLRRGARISGRVLAPDGSPAPDATVRLVGSGIGDAPPPVRSDAAGRYRLEGVEPGRHLLEARHLRYPPHRQEIEVAPGDNDLDLLFEPGGEVSGRVIEASGAPVGGARVELRGGAPPAASGPTGADGRFHLRGVAPGLYRLRARHAGHAPGVIEGLEVGPAGVSGLEVVLERGAAIVGRVRGLDLDDLGRLTVRATDGAADLLLGEVDYSGTFRVDGVAPGDWWLSGELPDGRAAEAAVTVPPGEARVQAELEFAREGELRGRVLLAGEALPDAEVSFAPPGAHPRAAVFTDYDGRFVLADVPPGGGLLRVVQGQRGVSHQQRVPPGTEHVVIDLPGASLAGTVRSASGGAPIDGALVSAERPGALEPVRRSTRSGPDGGFRFAELQSGRWQVAASADGFAPADAVAELSPDGGAPSLTLELEPTSGLEIGLRLPSGAAPATVHAALVDAAGRPVLGGTYPADGQGRIHLDAPSGTWRLLVASPGTATLETPVTAPGVDGPYRLTAAGALDVELAGLSRPDLLARLSVQGPDGRPVPVVGLGGRVVTDRPVVRGHARIDGLPAGGWIVRAVAEDGSRWDGHATVVAGAVTAVVLGPRADPEARQP